MGKSIPHIIKDRCGEAYLSDLPPTQLDALRWVRVVADAHVFSSRVAAEIVARQMSNVIVEPAPTAKNKKSTLKLTAPQRKVLKWLQGGWEAQKANGSAIHINGKRICNIDTITALKRAGLVEERGDYYFAITSAGREFIL